MKQECHAQGCEHGTLMNGRLDWNGIDWATLRSWSFDLAVPLQQLQDWAWRLPHDGALWSTARPAWGHTHSKMIHLKQLSINHMHPHAVFMKGWPSAVTDIIISTYQVPSLPYGSSMSFIYFHDLHGFSHGFLWNQWQWNQAVARGLRAPRIELRHG